MTQDIHVLTWDPVCQRSASIAEQLGKRLETIHYLWYRRPWVAPLKYSMQAVMTWRSLFRRRPGVVMVSNPPPFAACTAWVYCALTGSKLVVDAHTGVFLEPKWRPFLALNRFLMRRAALTLVTNAALQQQVAAWGARAFVLPDPLPPQTSGHFPLDNSKFNVAAVFSFYEDEPVEEMLTVALPADVHVYVTGDNSRVPARLRARLSPQVTLCGFLPRADYDALIASCDAVLVLCTRPHTLLCGAYEAVAAGKPLVTSRSDAMQRYFRAGTIYVDNTTTAIAAGLLTARRHRAELAWEMAAFRAQVAEEWRETFAACLEIIDDAGERSSTPVVL
jgi:glycosyltransferase involved in cell wall biosynthesis